MAADTCKFRVSIRRLTSWALMYSFSPRSNLRASELGFATAVSFVTSLVRP